MMRRQHRSVSSFYQNLPPCLPAYIFYRLADFVHRWTDWIIKKLLPESALETKTFKEETPMPDFGMDNKMDLNMPDMKTPNMKPPDMKTPNMKPIHEIQKTKHSK